jgi:hypothetical protein
MKRSMLRMPSEHCQAGKGYLKRTEFVQAVPNWDKKRHLLNYFIALLSIPLNKKPLGLSPSSTDVPLTPTVLHSNLIVDNPNRTAPNWTARASHRDIVQWC